MACYRAANAPSYQQMRYWVCGSGVLEGAVFGLRSVVGVVVVGVFAAGVGAVAQAAPMDDETAIAEARYTLSLECMKELGYTVGKDTETDGVTVTGSDAVVSVEAQQDKPAPDQDGELWDADFYGHRHMALGPAGNSDGGTPVGGCYGEGIAELVGDAARWLWLDHEITSPRRTKALVRKYAALEKRGAQKARVLLADPAGMTQAARRAAARVAKDRKPRPARVDPMARYAGVVDRYCGPGDFWFR